MPAKNPIRFGERFGRWTALERTERRPLRSGRLIIFRECRCDCGTVQFIANHKLHAGQSQSCGCLQAQLTMERSLKHGFARIGRTRIYRIWCGMLSRCGNPNNLPTYQYYGGRGISVCERWLKFENFLEDMGEPPPGFTIDRLDNNGNYCKENCAWRTMKEQANNRRPRRIRLKA